MASEIAGIRKESYMDPCVVLTAPGWPFSDEANGLGPPVRTLSFVDDVLAVAHDDVDVFSYLWGMVRWIFSHLWHMFPTLEHVVADVFSHII